MCIASVAVAKSHSPHGNKYTHRDTYTKFSHASPFHFHWVICHLFGMHPSKKKITEMHIMQTAIRLNKSHRTISAILKLLVCEIKYQAAPCSWYTWRYCLAMAETKSLCHCLQFASFAHYLPFTAVSSTCSCINFLCTSHTTFSYMPQLMASTNAPRSIQIHVIHIFYRTLFLSKKKVGKTVRVHLPSTLFHLNQDKIPLRINSFFWFGKHFFALCFFYYIANGIYDCIANNVRPRLTCSTAGRPIFFSPHQIIMFMWIKCNAYEIEWNW